MDPEELEVETTTEEEIPSARDVIEEAFNAAEKEETPEGGEPTPNAEEPVRAAETEERARDDQGRFVKAEETIPVQEPATEPPKGADGKPVEQQAEQPAPAVELKAPQSWKPEAREEWSKIPAAVQQEVARREQTINQVLYHTAQDRQMAEGLRQAAAPYAQFIAADGSNPVQAAANMFQTASILRTGVPIQKAQLIAGLVKDFGVDVQMLDSALSNQPMPEQQPGQQQPGQQQPGQQPGQYQDPRLDQFFSSLEQRRNQQIAQINHDAQLETAQFGQDKEFFNDVRDVMADLIEMASNRGVTISLEQAYNQSCKLDEGISTIIAQREQAQAAETSSQSNRRSRRAASSITGAPGGTPPNATGSLSRRAALEEAFEQTGS